MRLLYISMHTDLVIVHIIFRNIENFLPVNTSGLRYVLYIETCTVVYLHHLLYLMHVPTCSNSRAASIVISSQFNQRVPDDVFMDNPITLNFNFTTVRTTILSKSMAIHTFCCRVWVELINIMLEFSGTFLIRKYIFMQHHSVCTPGYACVLISCIRI